MESIKAMRGGVLFALLTLLFGFGLGAAFGAAEVTLKGRLDEEARAVLAEKYDGDAAAAEKVASKAWVYMKRAHLHANGLGATALGLILLLSFAASAERFKPLVALALGVGGLAYSMYWMFAALRAPGMGSTGAAKASLEWLAVPGSGLCIVGLLGTLAVFASWAWKPGG
jgi:hypothetical protein